MFDFWLLAYVILSSLTVLGAMLWVGQAWEHRRYAKSCMRALDQRQATGRALVLTPCKGFDLGLENNLRCLFEQDYRDYEITFVVESGDDPACPVIRRVMAEYPRAAAQLVVAGRATESGQKVHNLRAATALLSPSIRYLLFVDSDARPRPEWLRAAIARLDQDDAGAVTGYRWFVPARPTLANHVLYSVNCGVMSLLGRKSHYLVWGGSWAIRRDKFEQSCLREAWKGTLSDDLVAGRVLRRGRQSVCFEPACVVASPLQCSLGQMFSFIRRQYMVVRYYAPFWWLGTVLISTGKNIAWLATLVLLGCGACSGTPPLGIPLGFAIALYLLGVGHRWLVQDLLRSYFPERRHALLAAQRFDIWAGSLAGLLNCLGLLSSIFGRHIRWRGIRYRLSLGGQIRSVHHEAHAGSAPHAAARRAANDRFQRAA
ncbi:MAG: glycosyltransferase [Thermoguttaceae bacterium]|jgi:hypothetical protein